MKIQKREELFRHPAREFKGKPLWAWNGALQKEELLNQIDVMDQMGMGGFYMHSRTGLETEYLGKEWFDFINSCADYGVKNDMEPWLYDEDRWPSGSAGGMVTENPEYRASFIEMDIVNYTEAERMMKNSDQEIVAAFRCKIEKGIFSGKKMLDESAELKPGEKICVFKIVKAELNDNYNGYTYTDTMNKAATQKFIELTHNKYKKNCGDRLGKSIYGIFTDEPHRGPCFSEFSGGKETRVPYTEGLFEEFESRFGYSLKENLPELFLRKTEGELSKVKRDYFELCQQLFLENFAQPILEWCNKNNMILTGHVLHEDRLCCQAAMQGSLMRYYEYMDYPGIDHLGRNNPCYWIVKQISSVARQLGKKWILSEMYGCTGWNMSMQDYKNIGDWQALFGINMRCPHLSWYTMKGEAKRDYPASILHQSAWYKEYRYLEEYYSRIHVALYEGKRDASLLVINPIESVWARAYAGAFDGLFARDEDLIRLEEQYEQIFMWLTSNQIDFDYGEEDIMARHGCIKEGKLYVGCAAYDKVLVAGVDTLRQSTIDLLAEFSDKGGTVIFAGNMPEYIDAQKKELPKELVNKSVQLDWREESVIKQCTNVNGIQIESHHRKYVFVQTRKVDGGRFVMLWNSDIQNPHDQIQICFGEGEFLERWNPRNGEITEPDYYVKDGKIFTTLKLEAGGERLFFISDIKRMHVRENKQKTGITWQCPNCFKYELSEKNICVLDIVTVLTEDGWTVEQKEVLKADRQLREYWNIPYRGGEMLQPWYDYKVNQKETMCKGIVTLKYDVEISVCPKNVELVTEELPHIHSIKINDVNLPLISKGKWIDICFDRLPVPDEIWKTGKNTIFVQLEYYKNAGIEAIYLLGDFGVDLHNKRKPIVTGIPETLKIGDISLQGFPFYSGSIKYSIPNAPKYAYVKMNNFRGALVKLNGQSDEVIAFQPYEGTVNDLSSIEIYFNRRNTFGPLHQLPKELDNYGPMNFVTEDHEWTDEYVLYEQGLLEMPEIRQL